jgi:NAD(P)H-hydrate epimerase
VAAAKHLHKREVHVAGDHDRDPGGLDGVPAQQHAILTEMGVPVGVGVDAVPECAVAVDAIIGYGLDGPVRGTARDLVAATGECDRVVSPDIPSGRDATTGERPGLAVEPDRTLTLALPKTGLTEVDGRLDLADITVPATVYDRLDISYSQPFGSRYRVELVAETG